MKVTIIDRNAMGKEWGSPGIYTIITKTVKIGDYCPRCGKKRGRPQKKNHYEDGDTAQIDIWTNSCGHIDEYRDVLRESEQFLQQ